MEPRKGEIYAWVGQHPNTTELEIARGVGLKKTPYSRQILLWLVANGYLVRSWDAERQPAAYVYYVQQTEPMQ